MNANDQEFASATRETPEGVRVAVRVSTRKPRAEITGTKEGRIEIWLHSPPRENMANQELEKLLAAVAGIPASRARVIEGAKSRAKVVLLHGISASDLNQRLSRTRRR